MCNSDLYKKLSAVLPTISAEFGVNPIKWVGGSRIMNKATGKTVAHAVFVLTMLEKKRYLVRLAAQLEGCEEITKYSEVIEPDEKGYLAVTDELEAFRLWVRRWYDSAHAHGSEEEREEVDDLFFATHERVSEWGVTNADRM